MSPTLDPADKPRDVGKKCYSLT
ncbi:hypothetical protein [Legionella sp. PC1000]